MEVYRIVNLINNKIYIGRSKDARNRFRTHKYTANGGRGYQLHSAMRKYGNENFRLDILLKCDSIEDAVKKEQYFIKVSNSFKNGYNASKGGFGELRSEESYRELSKKLKGRKVSKETRKKLSKANKGKKISFEKRVSHMKPRTTEIWNKGKKLTKKQKASIQNRKRRPSYLIQIDDFCVFFSLKYAADFLNVRPENVTRWLNGSRRNTTNKSIKKVGTMDLDKYQVKFLLLEDK